MKPVVFSLSIIFRVDFASLIRHSSYFNGSPIMNVALYLTKIDI